MIFLILLWISATLPLEEKNTVPALRSWSINLDAESGASLELLPWNEESFSLHSGAKISLRGYKDDGRAISYAGEDSGLLCYLLGIGITSSNSWIYSDDLNFRLAGLGIQIWNDSAYARAALAPMRGQRWLLVLSPAASLDEDKLRKHLQSTAIRKDLRSRLSRLYRDAHGARNAKETPPPRFGYASLSPEGALEIGDPQSEESFAVLSSANTLRFVERLSLPGQGNWIDDGISLASGDSLQFSLDLSPLVVDDLLFIARSAGTGEAKLLIDGVELGQLVTQGKTGEWTTAITRISNRLIEGKEKSNIQILATPEKNFSIFRLEILRTPSFEGFYLSDLKPNASSMPEGKLGVDSNLKKLPLQIGGFQFVKGLSCEAPSSLRYRIENSPRAFEALIGVDSKSSELGPVQFLVLVEGKEKYKSPRLQRGDLPQTVYVDLRSGGKEIELRVENLGNSPAPAVIWAEARLSK